jgi:hypothetical protein
MANTLTNVSFDGSPVVFRMDSPFLACFDPVALEMLRELLLAAAPFETAALLEQAKEKQRGRGLRQEAWERRKRCKKHHGNLS